MFTYKFPFTTTSAKSKNYSFDKSQVYRNFSNYFDITTIMINSPTTKHKHRIETAKWVERVW